MARNALGPILVVLGATALAACAIEPGQIASTPTSRLCGVYGAPLNANYLDPKIRAELVRRGEAECTDPNLIAARQSANARMMQLGFGMMQQSAPAPAPVTTPYGGGSATGGAFLKSQYVSGFNRVCNYDRLGSAVAITVGSTQTCPLSLP